MTSFAASRSCLSRCPHSGLQCCPPLLSQPHREARVLLGRKRCIAAAATVPAAADAPALQRRAPGTGRMVYKPASFREIVNDAVTAVMTAIEQGDTCLEVEFPPLPVSNESYKSGSDSFVDSNAQLAMAGAKALAAQGRRVHMLMPDQGEYARTYKMFSRSLAGVPGVTLGHLYEREQATGPLGTIQSLYHNAVGVPPSAGSAAGADTFIVVNTYALELGVVEKYVQQVVGEKRVTLLWNLELDTLRGDLGMTGYPPKDLHHSFLARFRPAYYLRPRDYSKTVSVSPFILNYSGALFREFPGPWQVMLRQDNGEYACIAERPERYNLGETKEELLTAMGLNTEEDGSAMQFLRRGYKTSTWWEDATADDKSPNWRS